MKDNSLKPINIMTVSLSVMVFVVPVISKIKDKQMPEWLWAVLFLTFSMCMISITMDHIVCRIKYLEEKLQTKQTEKEIS